MDETANNSEIVYERQTPPEPQRIERANATPTQSRQEALQVETQPSRKSSTTSQFDQQTTQKADHSHQPIQQKKANEPKEKVESEKMSRRREQISKCMKGFDDVSFFLESLVLLKQAVKYQNDTTFSNQKFSAKILFKNIRYFVYKVFHEHFLFICFDSCLKCALKLKLQMLEQKFLFFELNFVCLIML